MTDAEQIEVWRKDFEQLIPNANLSKHAEGDYVRDLIDAMWRGFLMAKRSQPVIELPSVFDFRENPSYSLAILQNHLEDIGIKFRVKE